MRLDVANGRSEVDDLFERFLGGRGLPTWSSARWEVPTDVFHLDGKLVIRMELSGVHPEDVEVTVQENNLLINGTRRFPYEADQVRWVRRGTFYGDFTQRVALGKGLDLEQINARYDNGVLELTIPYAEQVRPKKVAIEFGGASTGPALSE